MASIFQNLEGFADDAATAAASIDTKQTATNTKLDTANTNLGDVKTKLDTLHADVDGLETAVGSTNTKLDTSNTNTGSIDTKLTNTNTKLDLVNTNLSTNTNEIQDLFTLTQEQAGLVDDLNTKTTTVIGHVDGIETLLTSANTKSDTSNTKLDTLHADIDLSNSRLGDIATNTNSTNSNVYALTVNQAPATATGNITTQNLVPAGVATAGSAVEITLTGRDTLTIQITGTYTGVLTPQGTVNGTTWVTLAGTTRMLNVASGAYSATVASATQSIFETSVAGLQKFRITGLAAVTGTATISMIAVDGNAQVTIDNPLPAGAAVIGAVTQSGTWTVGTNTPGVAATNLGKAEDAAHASGDTGVAVWGVRNDNVAAADFGANNDYTPFALDAKGAQFVEARPHTTATLTNVASSATNVTVLASNASRRGATIVNDSTQILYLKFGATASATSYTVKLVADAYYEVPFGYSGIIDGIWVSANGNARVTEITA